jgi:hypothetical protein
MLAKGAFFPACHIIQELDLDFLPQSAVEGITVLGSARPAGANARQRNKKT